MKKGMFAVVIASAVLGATSMAFAGAYGEPEQPEELPAPVPAAPAPEPEPAPRVMRTWAGFLTDAETTRGLRAEVGTAYAAKYHSNRVGDVDATNTYAYLSYGTELFEVGLTAPSYQSVNQQGVDDDNGFGDMRLWGKIMPLRTEYLNAGGGLILSFPTGDGDDGFGTSGYGFFPFLTLGSHCGPVDIRLSGGYDVYADEYVSNNAFDKSDLNLAALAPVFENDTVDIVVRGELVHNHFTDSDKDPVSLFPGVDLAFAVGANELILRPTLGIGITEAPDWQVGLGIAFNAPGI